MTQTVLLVRCSFTRFSKSQTKWNQGERRIKGKLEENKYYQDSHNSVKLEETKIIQIVSMVRLFIIIIMMMMMMMMMMMITKIWQ